MNLIKIIIFLIVLSSLQIMSKTMTGKVFEHINPPPWATSILVNDTTNIEYELKSISDYEIMAIKDFSRFAPDGKGENYLKVQGRVDKNGSFIIDFSQFNDNDLVAIVAVKDGFIKLWHTFRFCSDCNYDDVKILMVKKIKISN